MYNWIELLFAANGIPIAFVWQIVLITAVITMVVLFTKHVINNALGILRETLYAVAKVLTNLKSDLTKQDD